MPTYVSKYDNSVFVLLTYMGHYKRKPVFEGLQTTEAQTSLRIRAD